MKKLTTFLSTLAAFCSLSVNAQWSQLPVPFDANVTVSSLVTKDGKLFAGTYGHGIFSSFAIGIGDSMSAVNTGLTNLTVNSLFVNGTKIFAGTYGGIFVSTNNGTSWSVANTGLTSLTVSSFTANGTKLFAGTDGGGVFLSTNNGSSWSAVNNGLTDLKVFSVFANGSNIFAGTNGGVFLSTNNGASWSVANTGLTSLTVSSFAANGSNIVAGTNVGIFLSTNNGASWFTTNNGAVFSLTSSGSNIIAGTNGYGVLLSTDNGYSWSSINVGMNTSNVVFSLAMTPDVIVAGTGAGGGHVWVRSLNEVAGIKEKMKNDAFVVYPNPTTDEVTLQIKNFTGQEDLNLSLYDISGKLLLIQKVQDEKTVVSVSNYPAGCYFYDLKNHEAGMFGRGKLIITR